MTNILKSESKQPKVPQEEKKEKRSEKQNVKPIRWYNFRLIPIWLRIVIVLILLILVATTGLMIGFGVIGNGEPLDVLKKEPWQHILDIINGKE